MNILYSLVRIIITAALLSPVLWSGWNFGVKEFFPHANPVELFDAAVIMLTLQTLMTFSVRPIRKEIIPIYFPFTKEALQDNENQDE